MSITINYWKKPALHCTGSEELTVFGFTRRNYFLKGQSAQAPEVACKFIIAIIPQHLSSSLLFRCWKTTGSVKLLMLYVHINILLMRKSILVMRFQSGWIDTHSKYSQQGIAVAAGVGQFTPRQ